MNPDSIVIVAARRTPIGAFQGALAGASSPELGAAAIAATIADTGMDPADISIEVQDNVLAVSGERRFEEEVKEDKYYRIERRYGSFSRSIALPQTVDENGIEANYENGVLLVSVPKAEIAKPKKIAVAVGEAKPKTVEATGSEKK